MDHEHTRSRRTPPIRPRAAFIAVSVSLLAAHAHAEPPPKASAPPAEVPSPPPASGAETSGEPSSLPPLTPEGTAPSAKPASAPPPPPPSVSHAPSPWKFGYTGYIRAPLRFGIGVRRRSDYPPGYDVSGSRTTIHEATVPDDQTLSFQTTQHNPRSWGEAFFSFGNAFATGTIGFGSYNFTEAGFNDYEANWGITQGYVTLTPSLPWENVRLWAKAGAIVDKYGMSGRYDSGEYDMYMFGRTHDMGETAHLDYDLTPAWTLALEQGFGSKKPDPSIYDNARYTMLHHEHAWLRHGRDLEFGVHYLMSWSQEEYRPTGGAAQSSYDLAPRNGLPTGYLWVTGAEARAELGAFGYLYAAYSHVGASYSLTVSRALETLSFSGGGEYDLGVAGQYLDSPNCHAAVNPVKTPTPAAGSPAPPENWTSLDPDACSDGTGRIDAVHAHYEFSLTNFRQQITGGQRFWGAGQDVILKLYGLAAFVHSTARDTTRAPRDVGTSSTDFWNASPTGYAVTKTKFGADLQVQLLPWLTPAVRFDRVMPNNHLPEENFSVLSPRVSFKSEWVSHERITIGYSRYFYDQRECAPTTLATSAGTTPNPDMLAQWRCTRPPPSPVPYDGFGTTPSKQRTNTRGTGVMRPDLDVFKVEATMWW
ncbi:MAG TPA: hypothetical protein VMI54_15670 [Polyangiaceae bacterium]|nr:hypothetical protein [Polyangiaceae bacterium]